MFDKTVAENYEQFMFEFSIAYIEYEQFQRYFAISNKNFKKHNLIICQPKRLF